MRLQGMVDLAQRDPKAIRWGAAGIREGSAAAGGSGNSVQRKRRRERPTRMVRGPQRVGVTRTCATRKKNDGLGSVATLRKVEKVTEAADHVCDAEKVVKRAARTESGRHCAVLLEGKRFPVPRKCPQARAVLLDLYEIFRSAGAFPRATRLGGCVD